MLCLILPFALYPQILPFAIQVVSSDSNGLYKSELAVFFVHAQFWENPV